MFVETMHAHLASRPMRLACAVLLTLTAAAFAASASAETAWGADAEGLEASATDTEVSAPNSDADGYTYTVRIFTGAKGSVAGGSVIEITDLSYGDRVSFDPSDVTLDEPDVYYIKGIREAGRDNGEAVSASSFTVTEDVDFVIAYGIFGDKTAYTVRYVDESGRDLAPSQRFWGNVGDSPVLACRYIEGYSPQAYNLTGALRSDEAENVYTFVYRESTSESLTMSETTVTTTTTSAAGAAQPQGAEGDGGEAHEFAAEDVGVTVQGPAEAAIAEDGTPLSAPAETEDIRDEGNPLASFQDAASDLAVPVAVGAAVIIALIAAICIAVAMRRNRGGEHVRR